MSLSLDAENGGYEASDESIGFGDAEFERMFPADADADDALAEAAFSCLQVLDFRAPIP